MMCENCGKNTATTYIKKIINGVATQKHLCSACAAKYGFQNFAGNNFANLLSSMFGSALSDGYDKQYKRCSTCGSDLQDIINSGKVGCPECYTEFYSELLPYLKRIHGSVKHIGKVPNNAPLAPVSGDKLTELKNTLHELVMNEEFEKAAVIRDRIKELESEERDNG